MMMNLFIEAIVVSFAVGGVFGAIFALNVRKNESQHQRSRSQSYTREV